MLLRRLVFEITSSGSEKVLYTFTDDKDGGYPKGALVRDDQGNFYGTTYYGGSFGVGTVFELSPIGAFKVLYSFTGGTDGALPNSTLVRDKQGNLYGTAGYGPTTSSNCPFGCGEIFELGVDGVLTVLYNFTGGADGWGPMGGVLRDTRGNLYGTTSYGGGTTCLFGSGCGVVFALSASGTLTVLHSFTGGTDGGNPDAALIQDAKGNLYGTTSGYDAGSGYGTVFEVSLKGTQRVLHVFDVTNGFNPIGGLVSDAQGNLYGTTADGGSGNCSQGCGVVFELAPNRALTVLHFFAGGTDGSSPQASLVRDGLGHLYGTTTAGGGRDIDNCSSGCGTVFEVIP